MKSLQKLFNRIVGVHQPWYGRRGEPVAAARAPLPPRVELPACWRRRARHSGGVSTMIRT